MCVSIDACIRVNVVVVIVVVVVLLFLAVVACYKKRVCLLFESQSFA